MASTVNSAPLSLESRLRLAKIEVWIEIVAVPILLRVSGVEVATGEVCSALTLHGLAYLR